MAIPLPALNMFKEWADQRRTENLARQFKGKTPTTKELNELAHAALNKHQPQTLAALIRIGASPDLPCTYVSGYTTYHHPALTKMVRDGDARMAQVLIDNGADINKADTLTGHTPLHEAVILGATPFVQMLLEKGADLKAKTSIHSKENIKYLEGVTPIEIAASRSYTDIVGLLKAAADARDKAEADRQMAEEIERRRRERAAALAAQQAQDAAAPAQPASVPPPVPASAPEPPKSTVVKVFRKPVRFK